MLTIQIPILLLLTCILLDFYALKDPASPEGLLDHRRPQGSPLPMTVSGSQLPDHSLGPEELHQHDLELIKNHRLTGPTPPNPEILI